MTEVQPLARFVTGADYAQLSEVAAEQLKLRVLDTIGVAIGALDAFNPLVFEWYVKSYGHEVNLFVDHSQILQLEGLRQNIWGNKSPWGRVASPAPAG